jgi:UDP-3-O-[3-hydroxymyristoyl] glucosamine N-acyltransferase
MFVHFVNKEVRGSRNRVRITSTASVSRAASIGRNCQIADYVTIGDGCIIGNNVIIEQGATIHHAVIGDACIIQAGVAIGSEGFAYERSVDGQLERFPHLAGVRVGNNVEICANSSIARGALEDTVIGNNTKLDALVHVAHNVSIGENCQLAAGTIIGGSTKVGNSCWTGLNSTLKHHITIGNNVLVAAGACVIRDVADCDVVAGVPAKSIKDKVKTDELFLMTGKTHA